MKNIYLAVSVLLFVAFAGCSSSKNDTPVGPNSTHVYDITTNITPAGISTIGPNDELYTNSAYSLTAIITDNGNEIDGDIIYLYTNIQGDQDITNGNWHAIPQQTKQSGQVVALWTGDILGDDTYNEFKFDLTAHGVTKTLTFRVVPNPAD